MTRPGQLGDGHGVGFVDDVRWRPRLGLRVEERKKKRETKKGGGGRRERLGARVSGEGREERPTAL